MSWASWRPRKGQISCPRGLAGLAAFDEGDRGGEQPNAIATELRELRERSGLEDRTVGTISSNCTVVMATFNGAKYLAEQLASLTDQTMPKLLPGFMVD